MAGELSSLTELTSGNLDDNDLLEVVDVSDTSMAGSGTNKKSLWSSVKDSLKAYFDTLYATAAQGTDARAPTAHAGTHTDGTDDIQSATSLQKGLATSTQIAKLDGIEGGADVTDSANVAAAGALMTSALGTGVLTALAVDVGSAGSPVVNGGALGTPSSGTVTNLTGTASININGTVGATTAAAGAFTTITGTSSATLGVNGGTGGSVVIRGSSSGSATISASATGVLALPSGATATNMALTTPALGTPASGTLTNCTGLPATGVSSWVGMPWERCIALSDESTTDLTASTSVPKVSFYAPFALTLTDFLGSVSVAGTGSTIIMDVHVNGTTVMSTNKISIDASELKSDTAATPPAITTTAVAALALVELFIDQVGASVAGKGAKIQIYALRA